MVKLLPVFVLALFFIPSAAAEDRVDRFVQELEAAPGDQQLRVIAALGRSKSEKAGEALLRIFDVKKGKAKPLTAIAQALGRLKDPRATLPLMTAWDYLNSMRLRAELPGNLQTLRAQIVESLGAISDERASPVIVSAIQDEDPGVVRRGVEAAGRLRLRKAFEMILELLTREGDVGQAAYEALAEMKDPRALPTLEKGLASENPLVGAQAAYALARLDDDRGEEALRKIMLRQSKETPEGILAARYMVQLDKTTGLDYLFVVLRSKESRLRPQAALALGKAGNRKAVLPLTEILEAKDPELRLLAVRGLGRLGGPRAVRALDNVKNDGDKAVRDAAREALLDLGGDED